ncbi:MAG: hypothetical protein E5Y85_33390 [Mesorhizobium sp.]|nr:MAG: hypothetical protein E5Y85_33390 [Mesorhizobium sp.]TIL45059.1 MAG: hypothetical protein E5Y86_13355 [Mesorhizobium sp.]
MYDRWNIFCKRSDEKWMTISNEKALERRHGRETPLETAARLRAEFGIELSKQARKPLPRPVYDELSGED